MTNGQQPRLTGLLPDARRRCYFLRFTVITTSELFVLGISVDLTTPVAPAKRPVPPVSSGSLPPSVRTSPEIALGASPD